MVERQIIEKGFEFKNKRCQKFCQLVKTSLEEETSVLWLNLT